jgi:hypothetical protein
MNGARPPSLPLAGLTGVNTPRSICREHSIRIGPFATPAIPGDGATDEPS